MPEHRGRNRSTPEGRMDYVTYRFKMGVGWFQQTVKIGSDEWIHFLEDHTKVFSYTYGRTTITVRCENKQRGRGYWIAYKRVDKRMIKSYIGRPEKVTVEALREAVVKLEEIAKSEEKAIKEK